jgi:predicted lipoprotein with Yx(FWY)xxD motif
VDARTPSAPHIKEGKVKRTTYALALLAVVGAVVIAGCGGGSSSSSSGSTESTGSTSESVTTSGGGSGTIAGGEVAGLGTVLVDSSGMTVYEFTEDKGTTSVCYGGCEAAWPPVVASGKPSAGEGAMSAAIGTTKRNDGTVQVTYEGHPLYTYGDDKAPGEANGNEADGTWFALNEAGTAVKGTGSNETGTTTTQSTTTESGSAPASEEKEESSGGYGY